MQAHASPAGLALAASGGEWKLYRHLDLANYWITKLIRRQVPQRILVIDMPPRHGKSELTSHWTPTWFVQEYPDRLAGVTSYNGQFARKWGREARTSFQMAWEFHGRQIDRRRDGAAEWGSLGFRKGGMIAAGINEALTGRGLGLLIVDDPIKNASDAHSENYRNKLKDWWQSTAFTRLDKDGVAIIMQTRWHDEDLIGYLIEAARSGSGLPILHLHLPALAEENDPLGRAPGEALAPEMGWTRERLLESKQAFSDPYWWNALYQGRPGQSGRSEWPDSYFTEDIWARLLPAKRDYNVIALDPSKGKDAKKGDYPAVVRASWAKANYWVESYIRRQPLEKIADVIVDMTLERRPDLVYIEGNGGHHLAEPLLVSAFVRRRVPPPPIVCVDSVHKKEDRIATLGPHLNNHLIRFADTRDNRLLVRMLKEFPQGDYDDGPDALEMAIRNLIQVAALKTAAAKQVEEILNGRR